jgi:hypothetical protein
MPRDLLIEKGNGLAKTLMAALPEIDAVLVVYKGDLSLSIRRGASPLEVAEDIHRCLPALVAHVVEDRRNEEHHDHQEKCQS